MCEAPLFLNAEIISRPTPDLSPESRAHKSLGVDSSEKGMEIIYSLSIGTKAECSMPFEVPLPLSAAEEWQNAPMQK